MQQQEVILNHEAEIINQPPPQTVRQREPELFEDYELRGWKFTPRIYKIFAASAIINILFITVAGQADLLQTKACSSPLISKVCQVLDTVYVSSILLGTDTEYVSKDYERTELEDADITYIDVSNVTPPLNYPEGYFALANPEQFSIVEQADMNGFTYPSPYSATPMPNPTLPGNDLMNTPPVYPTPNNNPLDGVPPDSPIGNNPTINIPRQRQNRPSRRNTAKLKNESPNEPPKPEGNEVAKNEKEKEQSESGQMEITSETVKEIEINKKPLEDFADMVLVKWSAKEIDLNKQFQVVLNGVLTKDGKLDPKKSRWNQKLESGDPEIVNIARRAIESVGESGFMGYLRNFGAEKVDITLVQSEDKVIAVIRSEQTSAEKAQTMASGFNTLISTTRQFGKLGEDEKALLNGAQKPTSDGKFFVLNVELPKQIAQEMIQRKLKEAQIKKNQKPNSTAQNPNANQKTGK